MKKLCLILTLLYAFGANCCAQSSLNIAKNLLEGNSSTFDSDWGNWGEQGDYCGRSFLSNGGPDRSQCARLTSSYAPNYWDAQLKYNFSATEGTTYVFRLKAKKVSGNGTIKAIMQHNTGSFEQEAFFEENVTGFWATYEGEVTAHRSDYDVIMINYGNCGEVLIDDIEFGVKTYNVAPSFTTDLKSLYTVGQGGTLTLSVEASGTPAPTYQWYKNTTNSNKNGTKIDDATSATYSVPTETKGTYYYYCVATNAAGNKTSNVATVNVTDPILVTGIVLLAPNTMNVGTNAQCTVTITPDNATNQNVTWESSDDTVLSVDENGNLTAKSTGTATITVSSQDGGGVIPVSKEITVLASNSANGTYVENGMFYMLQDFGNAAVNEQWKIINNETYEVSQSGSAKIVADPKYGNVLHFKAGNNVTTEYLVFHCKLPEGKKLRDFSSFVFDYKAIGNDRFYKNINFYWSGIDWSKKTYPTFKTGDESLSPWHTSTIKLTEDIKTDDNEFDLYIGGIPTNMLELLITNIRLATDDSYTQNGQTNTWSKVESETLYVTGSGPMPDFNDNQPWKEKNNSITKVIVSENITEIGNNAFKDLTKDNVVIILKSIPDRFGANCFSDDSHTRILQLELHDAEKPYISKEVALNFPAFDKTTYFRDVTSNYSTVCLPFPVAKQTVTDAGVELFDFTSIEKNGEQYTLAFKKHSGDMEAGRTYLIKKHNTEVTLENTDVDKDQFILTPKESTKTITGSNSAFSISMTGVFQPSVFGPNLVIEGAPVYTYGFQNGKFYMNDGNMSVRPMRGYFYGSQLYSEQQSGAKKMPKMFNFEIGPGIETHISSPDFIAEDFNIEAVYSPSGMKTDSLNKGLNIIRTSTGRVLKVMVK